MGTIARLTFEEYQQLPESEGPRYELDEGTLMLSSPTWWHNRIRDRIARRLEDFASSQKIGHVTVETEFRLAIYAQAVRLSETVDGAFNWATPPACFQSHLRL